MEIEMNKNEISELLSTGIYSLEFTKKDGTNRKFEQVTTQLDSIPINESTTKRIIPENIITFYSLDEKCWRSCIKDNIISMDKIDE